MASEFIVSAGLWQIDCSKLVSFFDHDHTGKHTYFTVEYLAGQYAYYASTSRDSVNKRTFKDELKFLKELGIVFDVNSALEHAIHFSKMLDNPSAKLIWL